MSNVPTNPQPPNNSPQLIETKLLNYLMYSQMLITSKSQLISRLNRALIEPNEGDSRGVESEPMLDLPMTTPSPETMPVPPIIGGPASHPQEVPINSKTSFGFRFRSLGGSTDIRIEALIEEIIKADTQGHNPVTPAPDVVVIIPDTFHALTYNEWYTNIDEDKPSAHFYISDFLARLKKIDNLPEEPAGWKKRYAEHRGWDEQFRLLRAEGTGERATEQEKIKAENAGMPQHGLFIAGIVWQIAPEVDLYLVNVCDQYGQSHRNAIEKGITSAIERFKGANHGSNPHILVNLSSGMGATPVLLESATVNQLEQIADLRKVFNLQYVKQSTVTTGQTQPASVVGESYNVVHLSDTYVPGTLPLTNYEILELSEQANIEGSYTIHLPENALMVASAGNDTKLEAEKERRRWPRFPARLPGVVGVGAIDRSGDLTDFTNLPDAKITFQDQNVAKAIGMPDPDGLYTWGGYTHGDSKAKIISMYFGEKIADLDNELGLAGWAGTSFAAPIVTGVLARLCAKGYTPKDAHQMLLNYVKGNDYKLIAWQEWEE